MGFTNKNTLPDHTCVDDRFLHPNRPVEGSGLADSPVMSLGDFHAIVDPAKLAMGEGQVGYRAWSQHRSLDQQVNLSCAAELSFSVVLLLATSTKRNVKKSIE